MAKEEFLEFDGTVTELLPEGRYRVRLDNEHMVLAYTAGRMKKNKIKTLVGWDYSSAVSSAAAAYFNVLFHNILKLTFRDEMPEALWPTGGDRWYAVVSELMKEPNNQWWDDVTTKDKVETRDDIRLAAMTNARKELTSLMARSTSEWQWGRLHRLTLRNQTLGVSSADMKLIAKTIKKQQALACELYDTGIFEARYLAGMVADGAQLTTKQLHSWANAAAGMPMVSEFTIPWVALENPAARAQPAACPGRPRGAQPSLRARGSGA